MTGPLRHGPLVSLVVAAGLVLPAGAQAELWPPDGARLVLAPEETIEAEFPCEPLTGGLTLWQTADALDEWFPAGYGGIFFEEGPCYTTLYQFPSLDSAPHDYYWSTRQCLYVGTCSDERAIYGPVWSFTVERPPAPNAGQIASTPAPAPTPPAPPPTSPPPQTQECARAQRVARTARGRLRIALARFLQAGTREQRRTWRRVAQHRRHVVSKAQTYTNRVCG